MNPIFRRKIVIHRKIAWLLLFSIISLGVASWLIYNSKTNTDKTNFRLDQTYEIIGTIQEAINTVSESGSLPARYLDSLQQLTRENNDLQKHLKLLSTYTLEKQPDSANTVLHRMLREEKNILITRKHLTERANRRTAYGLVIARTAGFMFVLVILLQLNQDFTLHQLTQQKLIIAVEEAQKAKRLQEQFLANMSHEIRTPMNGIKGMTDLLLETPLSESQQEMAGMVKRSVNNLLVIINDILDLSKIQAGKLHLEKIDINIKEVLNNTVSLFAHSLKIKGLQLYVNVAQDIPGRLTGDPYRLNQILTNLLGNAIKFTEQGHIAIQVDLKERSADRIILSFTVADTGIGIPADGLSDIFDSFSQAGRDISRRYGGTGLGLSICKQLLHLQGGDIAVKSIVGKGSEFNFYLPFEYSNEPVSELSAVNTHRDYSKLLADKHFLVAEDNEINQKLIDQVLKKAGGQVTMANNGTEAVKYLQKNTLFDLIIMDLQMPEMDGYAATRYIRNNLHIQTPIIAMTATAMKEEHWQCLESGMNDYMTKPFEINELYRRIAHLLH